MRISDWSSDVCSSDLSIRLDIDLGEVALGDVRARRPGAAEDHRVRAPIGADHMGVDLLPGLPRRIGSTRLRVPESRIPEAVAVRPPAARLKENLRARSNGGLPPHQIKHMPRSVLHSLHT